MLHTLIGVYQQYSPVKGYMSSLWIGDYNTPVRFLYCRWFLPAETVTVMAVGGHLMFPAESRVCGSNKPTDENVTLTIKRTQSACCLFFCTLLRIKKTLKKCQHPSNAYTSEDEEVPVSRQETLGPSPSIRHWFFLSLFHILSICQHSQSVTFLYLHIRSVNVVYCASAAHFASYIIY